MNVNTGEIVEYDLAIPRREAAAVRAMSVEERKRWAAKKIAERDSRREANKRARKARRKARA